LLQAARRAPAKADKTGGDDDAGYAVKKGQPHYGYKAHVAVDETHTLIRQVTLTAANVHDSQEFENVVRGDEAMVMADKANWSKAQSEWCGVHGVVNGIFRKPSRGQKLAQRPHAATIAVHTHHQPDSVGSQCVACHMTIIAKTRGDVNVRRHTFRFVSPALGESSQIPNACHVCHADKTTAWATDALKTWQDRSPWRVAK